MHCPTPSECALGDWIPMMAAAEWDASASPCLWSGPDGEIWYFAFTEVPVLDDAGEPAGSDFVWIRCDPDGPCPPRPAGPGGFRLGDPDPADRWKSE